jgi:hypothetical protein
MLSRLAKQDASGPLRGAMSTRIYATDLNDAAWAWVAPYLPAARPGGRPRTTDLRAVLNAIFYLLRTLPCLAERKLLRLRRLSLNLAFNKMATP